MVRRSFNRVVFFAPDSNEAFFSRFSPGFFVYKLIKYIQNKEKPKVSRQEKKKALKTEKKLMKSPNSPKASASPNQSNGSSSSSSSGNKKKSKSS